MKRIERQLAAILASAAILGTAIQLPAAVPADQTAAQKETGAVTPALPAGHPPVPGATGLPSGHPPVPGAAPAATPALPAGHPPLPAGHPPIPGKAPSTQPSVIGTIKIQAIQGTAGGPAVGADPVSVEFYRNSAIVQKVEGKLDDKGQVSFPDIAVGLGVQALVKVTHAGVDYEGVSDPMTADSPVAEVKVNVHETTDQAPAWEIGMRHVMLESSPEGIRVMEMISVHNPADRAWLGTAGSDGTRTTFAWPLPAGATDVQIGGSFHDCCTVVDKGKVVNTMPLLPGQAKYQLAYNVPISNGKAEILISSPASVKHLMVFAADDGTKVVADGLTAGSANMGGQKTRYYKAADVRADQQFKVIISNIRQADAGGDAGASKSGGAASQTAKVVAGVGGLLIVLFGGAVMFARGSGATRKSS